VRGPPDGFRLILQPKMEGRLNMAIDEALVESVGISRSAQTVRLYGFSPPTLSLGRFQKVHGLLATERLRQDGVTLVRRPTGGHAVLHDMELSYSVVLSKLLIGQRLGDARKQTIYHFIATLLLAGLGKIGIAGRINSVRQGDLRNPDCFRSSGEFEITSADARKLIGSAQMTTRTVVLQHGSVPLVNTGRRVSRYLSTPEPANSREPTSLNDLSGRSLNFEEVQSAFAVAFREGLDAEESDLSKEEQECAGRILTEKYSSDSWNLAS